MLSIYAKGGSKIFTAAFCKIQLESILYIKQILIKTQIISSYFQCHIFYLRNTYSIRISIFPNASMILSESRIISDSIISFVE